MLIAQITDLHVTTGVDPSLADPVAALRRAVELLNTMRPRPDCVLATGDLVEHGTDAEYRVLFELLNRIEAPLHLLPGNHDDAPLLRMHLHFHGYLRADEPGHLGTVIESYPVRLVLLDTTDPARHDGVVPPERAAWLDRVLAAQPDRPTLVAMHHPAFRSGIWWMDAITMADDDRARFEAVVLRHRQVRQVVAGHLHRPVSSAIGGTVLTVCPSTVHQIGLGLGPDAAPVLTREPPSLQLHQWTGHAFVTHTRPLDVAQVADLRGLGGGWSRVAERLASGGPFLKGDMPF
jgi:3',5'-cyclic AMP phosphodiesterase CpdA